MRFSIALALCTTALVIAAPSKRWGPTGYNWEGGMIKGVNIGGWLVLEPWITPTIFDRYQKDLGIVDEYTLCNVLGTEKARQDVLIPHWESFIQLDDLIKIKVYGFNLVRIPIGYWAYDPSGSPYATGAAVYLERAVEWARQVGLKVIIDLHGAPGSQNGFDNSGQRTDDLRWQTADNVRKTLTVLNTIQEKYGDAKYDDVMAGIELLNEPMTSKLDFDAVKQFERDGFNQQRAVSQTRVVVIHDGFKPPSSYNGWLTPSDEDAQWVALDHHEYQVFENDLVSMEPWQHRQYVCNNANTYSGADKWTIVGEWSAAMTDCATYLNGYGIGARYDGSYQGSQRVGSCDNINSIEKWPQYLKDDIRGYIEAQMETFEKHTKGWVFWTWKTEASPEWDAQRLIENGIFPQPLTDRKFGAICI